MYDALDSFPTFRRPGCVLESGFCERCLARDAQHSEPVQTGRVSSGKVRVGIHANIQNKTNLECCVPRAPTVLQVGIENARMCKVLRTLRNAVSFALSIASGAKVRERRKNDGNNAT